jgi:hypothetical protein
MDRMIDIEYPSMHCREREITLGGVEYRGVGNVR